MFLDEQDLQFVLEKAWSIETSADPEHWSESNPAWGQCAVTALVVQDFLAGEIVWAKATLPDGKQFSHYFNFFSRTNAHMDFTRQQFPAGTALSVPSARTKGHTTREYILSNNATVLRCKLLQKNVVIVVSESELSLDTIQRLNKGASDRVYYETLEKLCRYFELSNISELIEYIPDMT